MRHVTLLVLSLLLLIFLYREQVNLEGIVKESKEGKTLYTRETVSNNFSTHAKLEAPERLHGNVTRHESQLESIRSWGCGRAETPLIFLHIGKMGGGSVRARFAAAALGYNRSHWAISDDPQAYYPVNDKERGYFCNSGLYNFRYWYNKTFEGTFQCKAVTPLGQALACPAYVERFSNACRGCPIDGDVCHRIYVGHNLLGNELHHLPPRYLQNWWRSLSTTNRTWSLPVSHHGYQTFAKHWDLLNVGNTDWCPTASQPRPHTFQQANQWQTQCAVPLAQQFDELALQWMKEQSSDASPLSGRVALDPSVNWGPLYASLPVLRTTVVRNPFSWFVSKFFWGRLNRFANCSDMDTAIWRPHIPIHHSIPDNKARGWAHRHALGFILHLCGEDCHVRNEAIGPNRTAEEEKIWVNSFLRQAEYNIRHSIAVVGLSEDLDGYYDMVTRRVQYLNMSLNLHVTGPRHPSGASEECIRLFADPSFRQALINASPAIAAAVQLYNTAAQVNAFHKAELEVCH